ncbi:MAG: tetratricopeptide repeat protein [Gammaproteobacteria bacterium]|nr:MAG: tetratricopeptide repeat protein [Gammaproteobacteria bacterium]
MLPGRPPACYDTMTTEPERAPLPTEVSSRQSEVSPHAHHPLLHFRVFEQLKQRNVFRVAVLYLVVCWLILDPVHVVFHMLDVPIWADRLVIMLMAVGFPAVVIFAWVYEITPEGLKPTVEVPHGQSIRKLTGRRLDRAIIAVLGVALAYFIVDKFWISKHVAPSQPVTSAAQEAPPRTSALPTPTAPFGPPPHSIAVLPFINLSGDQEQEYFSDGLTEELLNSLAEINELQVAARTSAFSFKGKDNDIGTIARKLNVATVLEGSVRRSAHTVRITAQLINAVTGFHLWSKTYDRDLGDVLKLQTEIATAVATALKVTLLGDTAARIELGGTHNPAAFDAYLRGSKTLSAARSGNDAQTAIAAYAEAIRLDPRYALALAGRSQALTAYAQENTSGPALRQSLDKAQADARRAIELAPDLAEGHLALARFFDSSLDFARASEEYERAAALTPGNAQVLREYGRFAVWMERAEPGIAAVRRALVLDPLDPRSHDRLGQALLYAHRYEEAIVAFKGAISLDPDPPLSAYWGSGIGYYALGNFQKARASCEIKPDHWGSQWCLAVTYDKLGRHADAEAVLAKLRASNGDGPAYQYATIYAQWGETAKALDWLEAAVRLHDTGLAYLKTDPLIDPLRKEPRFQAIERALKFPT